VLFLNKFENVLPSVIKSVHKYYTVNSGIVKLQFLEFLSNIRAILLLFFFVLFLPEPTDIPSHGNATTDGNKTRGISSGVSLTLSVLLVVRLLSISLFLLWASN